MAVWPTHSLKQRLRHRESLCEEDKIEYANKLISLSQVKGVKIHLPLDCVATLEAKADVPTIVIDTETSIPDDMMGLDIGPKTIKAFCEVIKEAKTIFWNGPMGVFELEPLGLERRRWQLPWPMLQKGRICRRRWR